MLIIKNSAKSRVCREFVCYFWKPNFFLRKHTPDTTLISIGNENKKVYNKQKLLNMKICWLFLCVESILTSINKRD